MFKRKSLRSGWFSLRMPCCLTVLLVVVAMVPSATSQSAGADSQSVVDAGNGILSSAMGLPSVFPIALQRNLVSRFSVGETYESGILNGRYRNASDTFTEASTALVYNLRRKRTEYAIYYKGSARHYRRYSNLDVLSHDLALSQIRQLSRHLSWKLNYRYSSTPDFNGGLLRENLAKELSLVNALPTGIVIGPLPSLSGADPSVRDTFVNPLPFGVNLLPTTVETLPPVLSPGDGLFALRSIRVANHAASDLNYDLNSRTAFFSQAGFQRTNYGGRNLFASDNYSLAAGMRHLLSSRTNLGIAYQSGRNELSSVRNRFTSQGLVISLNRQLTRSAYLTLAMGPMWTQGQSQETIPLSPLLANLLGRPALSRDVAQTLPSWMGSMGVAIQWHKLNLNFQYNRLVASTYGLGGASLQQHYSASVARQLRRGTSFSLTASYMQSDFLGILNPVRLNQEALSASFTHRLSSGVDFVAFVNYSKMLRGLHDSFLFNHNQFGIRFQFHLPGWARCNVSWNMIQTW